MRPLSPDSQRIAISCFEDGASTEATTEAVNCLRVANHYALDDIRDFKRTNTLFMSQQISLLESQRHTSANATGGVDEQINCLQKDLFQALMQKISILQRQSSSLANMDGSISRQIHDLKQQLDALVAQHSQPAPMAPVPSSSQAIQSTRDSQHDNTPLHAPSTSRLGAQSFPTSLRSFQGLDIDRGQSSNLGSERHEAINWVPIESSVHDRQETRKFATDDIIKKYLHKTDGTVRTVVAVESAMREDGFGVGDKRIRKQLNLVRGDVRLPAANDAQITAQLRTTKGTLRTEDQVLAALHAEGIGARKDRIARLLRVARETAHIKIKPTPDQLEAFIRHENGSVKSSRAAATALRTAGFGIRADTLLKQLKDARAADNTPVRASDDQVKAHMHNDDGSLKTKEEITNALGSAGMQATDRRIAALLKAALLEAGTPC